MEADQVLTTTRSVRKRMDFDRPVPKDIIEDCLAIATQAPSGSNSQKWHFIVITERELIEGIAGYYRKSFESYIESSKTRAPELQRRQMMMLDSAIHLAENMHRVPVMVLFCIQGRVENAGVVAQASTYGSILPAAWSFMLALRARSVGAAWTTLHLRYEKEVAELVGLPPDYTQACLMPVGYYTGHDFKPAGREPLEKVVSWNRFTRPDS